MISGDTGEQGIQGEAGHTPEFGVDYWTPEQQQEIISTATTNTINNYSSTITQIQSNASNALNTANTANTTANTAKSIAEGANQALSYANYQAMVTAFNSLDDDVYRVGQNVMIITLNVPDLWVSSIESTSASYTYTNDEAITTALSTNGYIQIGYYKLSALETQKVDLTDYYTKTGTENKIEDYLYQIMPTDSTSGAIATINDATTMFNAIDVSGTIKPVQDLHGYNNPYPAGGGKNLFDSNNPNLVDGYIGTNMFSTNNHNAKTVYIPISPSTTYTVSKTLGQRFGIATAPTPPTNNAVITDKKLNHMASSLTITSDANDTYLWVWVYLQGTDTGTLDEMLASVQIEQGVTATSYAPYSNVCPISGWTEVTVTRAGKNLLNDTIRYQDQSRRTLVFGQTTNSTVEQNTFLKAGTYTFSVRCDSTQQTAGYYRKSGDTGNTRIWSSTYGDAYATFTLPEDSWCAFWAYSADTIDSENIYAQVELGSTATAYEPYQGTTYPISWQTEAGTVYGGNLDVTTGVLTVDRVCESKKWSELTNNTNLGSNSRRKFTFEHYAKYTSTAASNDLMCNIIGTYNVGYSSDIVHMYISNRDYAWVYLPSNTDSDTSIQLSYSIAIPITYQLTPQQISFLLGTNNLWVDTGEISVTYKADIQKYIDKKTN